MDVNGEQALLIRKQVKNVYLRIKPPDAHIEITAPARIPEAEVRRFAASKLGWIRSTRDRIARSERIFDEGAAGNGAGWGAASGSPSESTGGNGERLRRARAIIEEQLPGLVDRWVPVVGRGPSAITLRRMTTRWGSCTPATGRIRLNLELAWLEPRFLEYVLVHELTHLRASGHGDRFQGLMDSYLPGWRELRRALNRYVII
ncbi:metal-dependent hydrolase [Bifidobacterium xylocopae]|uniref:Metal-dependent hydrolase n=1 Tax=Bifidobacterium xylocopae TaxID=2493119 RepID=A0A366KDQ9_9BIFI|nr:metal-dependent hydrolase [Bifidobacterium xylocopae]